MTFNPLAKGESMKVDALKEANKWAMKKLRKRSRVIAKVKKGK